MRVQATPLELGPHIESDQALKVLRSDRDKSPAIDPSAGLSTPGLSISPGSAVVAPDGVTFAGIFQREIANAANAQNTAVGKMEALASGASDDLHGTMISAKEAEISMKLVGTIRTKLIEAFHELWRTSV